MESIDKIKRLADIVSKNTAPSSNTNTLIGNLLKAMALYMAEQHHGAVGGYQFLNSIDDLPTGDLTDKQKRTGYVVGENIYFYVGTGGDTQNGEYQNGGSFRGTKGADGKSAYQTWIDLGNHGDETAFINSLKESGYASLAVEVRPQGQAIAGNTIYCIPDPEDGNQWTEEIYVEGDWIVLATHRGGLGTMVADIDGLVGGVGEARSALGIASHNASREFGYENNKYVQPDGTVATRNGWKKSLVVPLYRGEVVELSCKGETVGSVIIALSNEEGTSFAPVVTCTNADDPEVYSYRAVEDCFVVVQYYGEVYVAPSIRSDSTRLMGIEIDVAEIGDDVGHLSAAVNGEAFTRSYDGDIIDYWAYWGGAVNAQLSATSNINTYRGSIKIPCLAGDVVTVSGLAADTGNITCVKFVSADDIVLLNSGTGTLDEAEYTAPPGTAYMVFNSRVNSLSTFSVTHVRNKTGVTSRVETIEQEVSSINGTISELNGKVAAAEDLAQVVNGGMSKSLIGIDANIVTNTGNWMTDPTDHLRHSYALALEGVTAITIIGNPDSTAKSVYGFLDALPTDLTSPSGAASLVGNLTQMGTNGEEVSVTIPAGANYLYIMDTDNKSHVSRSYLPTSLKVDGVELIAVPSMMESILSEVENMITADRLFKVTLPSTGLEEHEMDRGWNDKRLAYYRTTENYVVSIEVPAMDMPLKVSMLCRVADSSSPITISARHSIFGSSTVVIYNCHGYTIANANWELKEIVLPIPVVSGTVILTIPAGLDFRRIHVAEYTAPQRTLIGGMFHAHLGIQFGRNTVMSFTAAAKYGFSHCISNVRRTSDGVLVCAHDDVYKDDNETSYNISAKTYGAIEEGGYTENNATTYNSPFFKLIGDHHLCTVEEFLAICAKTNMVPEFSVHSDIQSVPQELYALVCKYGLQRGCILKSGDLNRLKNLYLQFGDDATYVYNISSVSGVTENVINTFANHVLKIETETKTVLLTSTTVTGACETNNLEVTVDTGTETETHNTTFASAKCRKVLEFQSDANGTLISDNLIAYANGLGIDIGCYDFKGLPTGWYRDAMAHGINYFTTDVMLSVGVNF